MVLLSVYHYKYHETDLRKIVNCYDELNYLRISINLRFYRPFPGGRHSQSVKAAALRLPSNFVLGYPYVSIAYSLFNFVMNNLE